MSSIFFSTFFDENLPSKPNSTPHSARSHLGPYCLLVINRRPCLYELMYCVLKK